MIMLGIILTVIDFARLLYYATSMGFENAKRMIDSEW